MFMCVNRVGYCTSETWSCYCEKSCCIGNQYISPKLKEQCNIKWKTLPYALYKSMVNVFWASGVFTLVWRTDHAKKAVSPADSSPFVGICVVISPSCCSTRMLNSEAVTWCWQTYSHHCIRQLRLFHSPTYLLNKM